MYVDGVGHICRLFIRFLILLFLSLSSFTFFLRRCGAVSVLLTSKAMGMGSTVLPMMQQERGGVPKGKWRSLSSGTALLAVLSHLSRDDISHSFSLKHQGMID